MRYLLAFGPSPTAALLAADTHAAMAAAGHRRVGEDVLLSHHLLPQAIATEPEVVLDYLALVQPDTFGEVADDATGTARMLVAARVGTTRLIDTMEIVLGTPSGLKE